MSTCTGSTTVLVAAASIALVLRWRRLRLNEAAAAATAAAAAAATGVEDVLTVVITTSPTRSNPSTKMLEFVVASFDLVPHLQACRKVIVCDGYSVSSSRSSHKGGVIRPDEEARYLEYIDRIRALSREHPHFLGATVVPLQSRHGFGYALREGLREVTTEFVIVVQHDRAFLRPCSLPQLLGALRSDEEVKYIMLPNKLKRNYRETMASVHRTVVGARQPDGCDPLLQMFQWCDPVPPHPTPSRPVPPRPTPPRPVPPTRPVPSRPVPSRPVPSHPRYDSTHITRLQHYVRCVFESGLARRGDFIEASFGVHVKQDRRYTPSHTITYRHTPSHTSIYRYTPLHTVRRAREAGLSHTVTHRHIPLHTVTYRYTPFGVHVKQDCLAHGADAHRKYGTWLLADSTEPMVGHIDGRGCWAKWAEGDEGAQAARWERPPMSREASREAKQAARRAAQQKAREKAAARAAGGANQEQLCSKTPAPGAEARAAPRAVQ